MREALSLPPRGAIGAPSEFLGKENARETAALVTNIVLEAEMVAFSQAMGRIDGSFTMVDVTQLHANTIFVQNFGASGVWSKAGPLVCGGYVASAVTAKWLKSKGVDGQYPHLVEPVDLILTALPSGLSVPYYLTVPTTARDTSPLSSSMCSC